MFSGFYIFKTLLRIFHTVIQPRLILEESYLTKVPYGINVLISCLLLAQEVFSVDIEPFYHPADVEGLFLRHLLGDCAALYTFLNNLLT